MITNRTFRWRWNRETDETIAEDLEDYIHRFKTEINDQTAWDKEHRVAKDELDTPDGPVSISTVFLAHDHNFTDDGQPVLFETMIFGGALDGEQWRYHTANEARAGHLEAIKRAKEATERATDV